MATLDQDDLDAIAALLVANNSAAADAVANLNPSGKGADTLGGQIARTYTNSEEAEIIIGAIVQDTVDIQSRLPAALVGGRMDSHLGATANNVIGTVVIAPIQAEVPPRSVETLLRAYRGETVDQIVSVVESDGTTPVDLSGKSLEIVFEGYLGTDLAVIATANITVSGDDNNVVTFAYPSAVTATVGRYYWSLRDDAAPSQVYLNGEVEVLRAAVNDP